MRNLDALRANGHAVENKLGMFSVSKGTHDLLLISKADAAVKKYIEHFEKAGWRLESRPRVRRLREWKPKFRIVTDNRGARVAVPVSTGMRPDHPWYIPDVDQYEVTADWSRPHRPATLEVPDATLTKLIEQGTLPVGVEVH